MAEAITLLEAWIKLNTKGPDAAQQRDVENSLEAYRLGLAGLLTTVTATATAVFAATKEMSEGL
jgi:hypothetical protein